RVPPAKGRGFLSSSRFLSCSVSEACTCEPTGSLELPVKPAVDGSDAGASGLGVSAMFSPHRATGSVTVKVTALETTSLSTTVTPTSLALVQADGSMVQLSVFGPE